jgi:uncharacterized damage-inducible protein DinB
MTLRDALSFHRWATLRTLETSAALTPEEITRDLGGSFPSLRDTLAHSLMADNAWAHRVRGEAFERPPPEALPSSVEALRAVWETVLDAWQTILETRDPSEVIAYRAFDGSPYQSSLEEIVRHVVNHGSYHRGQVMMMLRLLGHAPASTDWIAFSRQNRTAPSD